MLYRSAATTPEIPSKRITRAAAALALLPPPPPPPPRPVPRRSLGYVSDSDGGFNIRRNRERATLSRTASTISSAAQSSIGEQTVAKGDVAAQSDVEMAEGPKEPIVEESDLSGSDFDEGRLMKQKRRARAKSMGRDVSDTEEEDAAEDRELEGSVVPETPLASIHVPEIMVPATPCAAKMKGAEATDLHDPILENLFRGFLAELCSGEKDAPGNDGTPLTNAVDMEGSGGRRVSKLEEHYTNRLGAVVEKAARAIGLRFGRKQATILTNAGLKIKPTRRLNTYQDFLKWYALQPENAGLGREY